MVSKDKEYYAFISYSHKDEEWAKWLQHEFEHYHLPTTLNGLTNLPDKFRPIFRDIDELSGGELKPQISYALRASAYLVIICSPNSAKSTYVDGEIQEFLEIGEQNGINNIGNIFPFIIEGMPHSKEEPEKECFPKALRELPSELIAGDVTKHGREQAFVKILAGTLQHSNVRFSMLWNQFERDRIEAERKEREKRDKLLLLESRYLSEKALDIASVDSQLAKLLILRALPKDINNPEDRPYCSEAESALRKICTYKSKIIKLQQWCITNIELNSKGSNGVSITHDGKVRIWDLEKESQVGELLKDYESNVLQAIYSQSGKIIASSHEDGTILLWDADTGEQIGATLIGATECINRMAFTHDDKLLIVMYHDNSYKRHSLKIWNVKDNCLVNEIQIPGSNEMAIDRNNKWIALAVYSRFSIVVYDLNTGKMIKEIPEAHSESLSSVDFSPDGNRIVSASFDGKFKIWDWMKNETILTKNVGKVNGAYAPVVNSSKFSNDGKFVVTASQDHVIRIWNTDTGELHGKPLVGHTDSVYSAYFSQDGRCVISKSSDRTLRIWDLNPQVPYNIIGRARFFPYKPKVAYNEYNLKINGCDINIMVNEKLVKTIKGHQKPVNCAIFNPDGTKIVSTSYDGTARLWDVNTGEQIGCPLEGHSIRPHLADFSQDGKLLITGSEKELKVWDINSNVQLGQDITFFDDFYQVMFTENGRGIICETEKDYDIIFEWLPLQELIDKTRKQVKNRKFTETEIKKYYLD